MRSRKLSWKPSLDHAQARATLREWFGPRTLIRLVPGPVEQAEVVLPGDRILARVTTGSAHTYTDLVSACIPYLKFLQRRVVEIAARGALARDLQAAQEARLGVIPGVRVRG